MMMDTALLARQRHHERIEHALGPRPELYSPITPGPEQRSSAPWTKMCVWFCGQVRGRRGGARVEVQLRWPYHRPGE